MKRTVLLIFIGLILYCAGSWGQEIYQWKDEKGVLHFTDDMSLIPERYRDQVQKKKVPKEPSPLPRPPGTTQEKEEISSPLPEQKDIVGRGEEWWRTQAREWNEKLLQANQNYETVYAEWKAKEKELEESKFKPKSLQRKLMTEMKLLEDRMKEWEKQKEEAKNMLENVLPKEAEDYHANPDWIKIEQ